MSFVLQIEYYPKESHIRIHVRLRARSENSYLAATEYLELHKKIP